MNESNTLSPYSLISNGNDIGNDISLFEINEFTFFEKLIRLVITRILVVFSRLGFGRSDALLSLADGMKIPK